MMNWSPLHSVGVIGLTVFFAQDIFGGRCSRSHGPILVRYVDWPPPLDTVRR